MDERSPISPDPVAAPDPDARPGAVEGVRPEGGGFRRRLMGVIGWLDRAGRGRRALPALFFGSVLESTVFPWPIEFPMLAYMLRGRRAVVEVVTIVSLGSVLGCLISYLAGRLVFEALEGVLAARPGLEASLAAARGRIDAWGPSAVFVAMLAPVPVQIASLAAGLAAMPVWAFLLAALAGRSLRYWAMGVLVFFYGEPIMGWWRRQPRRGRRLVVQATLAAFMALFLWTVWRLFAPAG